MYLNEHRNKIGIHYDKISCTQKKTRHLLNRMKLNTIESSS